MRVCEKRQVAAGAVQKVCVERRGGIKRRSRGRQAKPVRQTVCVSRAVCGRCGRQRHEACGSKPMVAGRKWCACRQKRQARRQAGGAVEKQRGARTNRIATVRHGEVAEREVVAGR